MKDVSLDSEIKKGNLQLGRGNIISSKDVERIPGSYPIYSSSAKGSGEFCCYGEYMFNEELVTWSIDGGGRFFYRLKHKFSVTNVSGFMRVDDSAWNILFVYYCLDLQHRSIAFDYQSKAHPSVIRHLYRLPCFPRSDQEMIAAILSTIDKAIEKTEAIIAKQQRIKTGLMQDLLTRGIDEHGNLRSEETHAFKDSQLGRIPEAWEVRPCGSLCSEIVVGIVVRPAQYYCPDGVSVLRSANVRENCIDKSDMVFMSEASNATMRKSQLREGDVVTVRTGYPGTTAVIPKELDGSNCVDILISRPDRSKIRENFLSVWINSVHGKRQVAEGQGGLAQQHFNVGAMRRLLVRVPSISEQYQIEGVLTGQSSVLDQGFRQRHKLHQMKVALMQDLLTGKVRVTPLLEAGADLLAMPGDADIDFEPPCLDDVVWRPADLS